VVGEFIGEIATATWFVSFGIEFCGDGRRLLGPLGIAAGLLVGVPALRNITSAVDLASAINNVTLPLWLITLGVVFFRQRPASSDAR
jgi:hypothetical protein